MARWGAYRRYVFALNDEGNESQVSSTIIDPNLKNEDGIKNDEFLLKESLNGILPNKRRRFSRGQAGEVEVAHVKQRKPTNKNKKNHGNTTERWSAERYKLAEGNMFKAMKDLGATFTNRVSRPVLRSEARMRIGDTGLLDHLLKQMDGKVMPGGTERFKRCFNTSGVMEYWLESADRAKTGEQESRWIPPNRLMPPGGSAVEPSVSATESHELESEITKLKRELQELLIKKQEKENVSSMKELMTWRAKTEGRVNEIESCVRKAQSMLYEELMAWKTKVEKQLAETKTSLSSFQGSKQYQTRFPPTYQWDEWFGDINLDVFPGDRDHLWLEEPDPDDHDLKVMGNDASSLCFRYAKITTHHLDNGKEQLLLEDQRNVAELVPGKEERPPITPDSCAIDNSKPESDTSFLMVQELFEWKPKLEQQLVEISNSMRDIQARNGMDQTPLIPCTQLKNR